MSATNRMEYFNVKVCEEASRCTIGDTCSRCEAGPVSHPQGEAAKYFALSCSGLIMSVLGQAEEAIERAQRALRLSPFDPLNYLAYNTLAVSFFLTERYESARDAARLSVQLNPNFSVCHLFLAAALVRLGAIEEANRAASTFSNSILRSRSGALSNGLVSRRLWQPLWRMPGTRWVCLGVRMWPPSEAARLWTLTSSHVCLMGIADINS